MNWYPFYPDMSPYQAQGRVMQPIELIRHIGWLGNSHAFPMNEDPPTEFVYKLKILIANNRMLINRIRGYLQCELCGYSRYSDKEGLILGNAELLIPSSKSDIFYCSPTLIYHYVSVHKYSPPQEFVDTVILFNPDDTFVASDIYFQLKEALLRQR